MISQTPTQIREAPRAYQALLNDLGNPAKRTAYDAAYAEAKVWESAARHAVSVVGLCQTENGFADFRSRLPGYALFTLAGVLAVGTWGLGGPTPSSLPVVLETSTELGVELRRHGPRYTELVRMLGEACVTAPMTVMAMTDRSDTYTVLLGDIDTCDPVLLQMTPGDADIRLPPKE